MKMESEDYSAWENEDSILNEFLNGGLKYLDAIQRLEGIGYDPKDAERLVNECIEANSGTDTE